ncbi:MAG TPA: hypothetical protein VLK85_17445 [Ramlibacter sp.]|nr:hypothetical protein [Ramlibacter sp.]
MPAAKKAVPKIPLRAELAPQPAARAAVAPKAKVARGVTRAEKAPKAGKPKAAKAPKADKVQAAEKVQAADKADKSKKPKLVRDSFTIPKAEYAVLEELKLRAAKLGQPTKKSEVLRAGVKALAAMADAAFLSTIGAVPTVKTGRPART